MVPTHYEQRVLRVLQHIHENPGSDLSLDALADVAAMSRFHWHRVFHAMTGETCAQAVRRVRMLRAARWLATQEWSIAEVADRVGYPNLQSFTRAFSEHYGVSPGLFRREGPHCQPPKQTSKGKFKMFDVEIDEARPRRLAALLHRGPYTESSRCFERLGELATSQNLWPAIQGVVGVYHDDPNIVAEADLRCHAGLIVADEMKLPKGLEEVSLVGGRYAILHYKGPYPAIKIAYDFLYGNWLPNSGREPRDAPCYEMYLNNPAVTEPEDLLTDIHLPLAS